jgi:hypothetical protein
VTGRGGRGLRELGVRKMIEEYRRGTHLERERERNRKYLFK